MTDTDDLVARLEKMLNSFGLRQHRSFVVSRSFLEEIVAALRARSRTTEGK